MKTKTKVLSLMLSAALLVGATVAGTMAYLTDTKAVTNTFTVGNVKITLDETDVDGSKTNVTTEGRDQENSYKLIPGKTYTKDPIVHVAEGSEDCYVFVKVENGIADIEADTKIADQMTEHGWVLVSDNVYVYTTDKTNPAIVNAKAELVVFDNFTVAGTVDNATLAENAGKTIKVTAYAIQADGFENQTASQIWNAGFNK